MIQQPVSVELADFRKLAAGNVAYRTVLRYAAFNGVAANRADVDGVGRQIASAFNRLKCLGVEPVVDLFNCHRILK